MPTDDADPLLAALLALRPSDGVPVALTDYLRRPAWHDQAACRGVGPAIFYPERGDSLEPAREHCARCPVVDECRRAASDEPVGVWGGTSAQERRRPSAWSADASA